MGDDVFILMVIFSSITVISIGIPLARAYARRIEKGGKGGALSADEKARLERIEQTVESMALELERIGEGQRFVTKLLSERSSERLGPGSESR